MCFFLSNKFYNLDSRHWCRKVTSKRLPVCNRTEVHKASGLMVPAFLQYGKCHSSSASQFKYCCIDNMMALQNDTEMVIEGIFSNIAQLHCYSS